MRSPLFLNVFDAPVSRHEAMTSENEGLGARALREANQLQTKHYMTLAMAPQSASMFASVIPATLMRPEPTM